MWAAFLTTVLFSISAVCGSRAARVIGGTEANLWRLCLAAALLGLYVHFAKEGLESAALPMFVLSGSVGFGLGDVAYFHALPRLGSRLTVMLVLCLSSPLGALLEWGWLGTGLTTAEIVCGLATLAGVVVALTPGEHLKLGAREFAWGLSSGLVAAFCQGCGAVLSRRAFEVARWAGEDVNGLMAAYWRILGGIAATACCVLLWKRREFAELLAARLGGRRSGGIPVDGRWREAWYWIVLTGLAGPMLGVSCFQWALKSAPTGIVLPIVAITPIVIIPFARYVEGERPTLRSLAGGAVAVGGAVALALVAKAH
jgi:drug/metabolite transporter (DMT)-like permease